MAAVWPSPQRVSFLGLMPQGPGYFLHSCEIITISAACLLEGWLGMGQGRKRAARACSCLILGCVWEPQTVSVSVEKGVAPEAGMLDHPGTARMLALDLSAATRLPLKAAKQTSIRERQAGFLCPCCLCQPH